MLKVNVKDLKGSDMAVGADANLHFEIRAMKIDDLAAVFHMGEAIFTAKYPNLQRMWDEYEVTGMFNTDTEFCMVADSQQQVIGFVMGKVIDKPRIPRKYGYLAWLGVAPGFQRFGVAGKLFEAFKQAMLSHRIEMILVDTQTDNTRAISFFQSRGFTHPTKHLYLSLDLTRDMPSL